MDVAGGWWVLFEDEPLDVERSRLYDLRGGRVLDGRSGTAVGQYEIGLHETVVTLDDRPGDNTMYRLQVGSTSIDVEACAATWTTSGYELYRTNWPVPENEALEDQWDREDWEDEHFRMGQAYGFALRDSPELRAGNVESVLVLVEEAP